MNPEIARKIHEIRWDRSHGASRLSRQAIHVMGLAIEKSEAKTVADFLEELSQVAQELAAARGSMASITNCVSRFAYEVFVEKERDLDSLKSFALEKGDELVRHSEEAMLKAAEWGARAIENRDRLMTCSYSSTICETFAIAAEKGKHIHVIVAESKSGGKLYGEIAAGQLKSQGISTEIIPDSAIPDHISTVNKVFVGADSMLGDGSLINGVPTCKLALAAKARNIPFYSVCETIKFDARSLLGEEPELEEGFEKTPPWLITGIITEEGTIKPSEVTRHTKKMEVTEWMLPFGY